MREIKFRAYYNNASMLYSDSYINLYFFFELQPEKYPFMQYTGLKDKNGKEIYEGDFLGGYPHGSVVVKWDNKFACFSCYGLDDNNDYGLFANEFDNCKDAWEVIGNIYENTELLK